MVDGEEGVQNGGPIHARVHQSRKRKEAPTKVKFTPLKDISRKPERGHTFPPTKERPNASRARAPLVQPNPSLQKEGEGVGKMSGQRRGRPGGTDRAKIAEKGEPRSDSVLVDKMHHPLPGHKRAEREEPVVGVQTNQDV